MKSVTDLTGMTVNDVIRLYPRSIELFSRHGIDACCGGAASVIDAAQRHHVDVDALLAELQTIIERGA